MMCLVLAHSGQVGTAFVIFSRVGTAFVIFSRQRRADRYRRRWRSRRRGQCCVRVWTAPMSVVRSTLAHRRQ